MRTATLFAAGLLAGAVSAQGVITRMNAGVSHFYYEGALSIQDALDEAENDAGVDTILLGGGSYVMAADIFVNSPVVLIGTGIHPDSSLAYNNNGRTEIDGGSAIELYIDENATGSQFHGIALVNGVDIAIGLPGGQLSSTDADSILFSRCEIPGLYLGYGSAGSLADDTYIQECVIGYLDISESNNAIVRNSVLLNLVNAIPGNDLLVENCIFQNVNLNQNAGAQYERNVFLLNTGSVYNLSQQSSFNENLFVGTGGGFNVNYTGGNGFSGNEIEYPVSGASGAFPNANFTTWNSFDYHLDYHLNPIWDDLDAGIFGGGDPWKEGSVPFNPHWIDLDTPNGTDNGTLQGVTIKASAQQD